MGASNRVMKPGEVNYLWRQILQHTERFFTREALDMLQTADIRFLSYTEAIRIREPVIAITIDINNSARPKAPYKVPFNGTELTLWNPLPPPPGDGWSNLPCTATPLWYRHEQGTLIPAWHIFANLFDLLTLREERESPRRDAHGRFTGSMSPRREDNLLEVPAFNEGVAVLVAACRGLLKENYPGFDLKGLVQPPVVVLSHDNDILRGNDVWTQAVRFLRIFQPLLKFKPPRLANFWWILRNTMYPKAYYLENLAGMVDVERMFGYTSSFYFLNGTGGRLGARSGSAIIPEAIRQIPPEWPVGIHYNYDTLLNADRFNSQLTELCRYVGRPIISGRAHYLRFDPEKSFSFLASMGIQCDESLGYSDYVGYRCGIAGPFQPYDHTSGQALPLWEVPLTMIENTLLGQYPRDPAKAFHNMLYHISRIGGAISLLIHPGLFFNPEFPETRGLYRRLLRVACQLEARGEAAVNLLPPK